MSFQPTVATVWVTHRFPGFHSWPDAPDARGYLRHSHRHLFHVKLGVAVTRLDRQIEFHDLLDELIADCRDLVDAGPLGSCEEIANRLATLAHTRYPHSRRVVCDVSEDGEAGAEVALFGDGRQHAPAS